MEIFVCIGSSCHQRSSYSVMKEIRSLITEHGLGDRVALSSAFCLGKCESGATIKIDDNLITGVSLSNIDGIFKDRVLGAIK